MKNLIYIIKPPCPKCPYMLKQVQFAVTPCPECKQNGYNVYRQLVEQVHTPNGSVKN